jgi:hypothetical protein
VKSFCFYNYRINIMCIHDFVLDEVQNSYVQHDVHVNCPPELLQTLHIIFFNLSAVFIVKFC